MLFVRNFDRALVIGLGTGVTAHTVASAPFPVVDIAEIAPGILEASRKFFSHVNGGVLEDARVTTHLADGRNFLLLSTKPYDLITIELSNIWFAGAANLYSRDFYELCRSRLQPRGVLQQWVQLHHIDTVDFISVIKTMRDVFPHMALFVGGGQGILVGSAEPLAIDYGLQARLRADPRFRQALVGAQLLAGEPLAMLNDLYLFEDNLTAFVADENAAQVSSDAYPFLEYSTPRGNQLPYSILANHKLLEVRRFRGRPPILDLPVDKARYLDALLAIGQGRLQDAVGHLEASLKMGNTDATCGVLLAQVRRRLEGAPAPALPPTKTSADADGS
jgi:spermidine synthase